MRTKGGLEVPDGAAPQESVEVAGLGPVSADAMFIVSALGARLEALIAEIDLLLQLECGYVDRREFRARLRSTLQQKQAAEPAGEPNDDDVEAMIASAQ